MKSIPRKLIVDERGKPLEVIIPWSDFQEIEQALGLDLDAHALADLRQAKGDRESGRDDAYLDLDSL